MIIFVGGGIGAGKSSVAMHKNFMKEFEPFKQSILVCRNDGLLKDTIKELKNLFDTIAICSNLTSR